MTDGSLARGETVPLVRLEADGLIRRGTSGARTTARWQAAMARAALCLYRSGAPWQDLRLPIATALMEFYDSLPDEQLADLVEAMLPIEAAQPLAAQPGAATARMAQPPSGA